MNFNEWAPLKLVDSDFLKRVRLCYVFGKTGHEALMVTDEDYVYACGSNFGGCLGLEDEGPQLTIAIIPELSKKKIKGFSSCIYRDDAVFVIALTFAGQIYSWGKIFTQSDITVTPTLNTTISKKIIDVECGFNHCLALTEDGEVYSWGYNECGQLGHGYVSISEKRDSYGRIRTISNSVLTNCVSPTLVQGLLKGRVVTKISCGTKFSVALLDNGEIYTWGDNSDGQLGVNTQNTPSRSSPAVVSELNGIIIRKITCGASYVLAISDVCELYAWGKNDLGQLGYGDTTSKWIPTKIRKMGRVIDIATMSTSSTSAAINERCKVYMWGSCEGLNLKVPTKTQFENMYEVFANFSEPRIMPKPMSRNFHLETVGESIKFSFGDVATSDLTIVAEEKEIFVHKVILKIRSNYFKLLLQEPWVKEDDKLIKINQNYDGIYAYLQYIYTGHLEATPEVALELLKIADEYHDLILKKICEKAIKHGITTENVATLYSLALKLGANKLAKYCMTFAGNHIGEVIQTPGYSEWDIDTCKKFIEESHKRKIFRS